MTGRVLITGANGFIGRAIVQHLAQQGWHVRAALRSAGQPLLGPDVETVLIGDLAGSIDWAPLVAGMTHVVHMAGIAHSTAQIPAATYDAVNALATQSLAVAARAAGLARIVFISSVRAQSATSAVGIVDEHRAPAPDDAYGRSKLDAERRLAQSLDGGATDWCVLRPVVVYGQGVKGNMHRLLQLARAPLPLPLGALTSRRSLLGLENAKRAVSFVLEQPPASRRTFLLADPAPLTVPQIVGAMRQGMGRAPRIVSVPLGAVRLAAFATGQGSAWQRVDGDLIVSTGALEAAGWRPVETAAQGLVRWMQEETAAADPQYESGRPHARPR